MEEWVGAKWHKLVTRLADDNFWAAHVSLDEMRREIGLLFRAGGGAAQKRLAAADASQKVVANRKFWAKIAGTGTKAALATSESDVLALPPFLAIFDDKALNQQAFLWLAALASAEDLVDSKMSWIAKNVFLTNQVFQQFPGLKKSYKTLCLAHLKQRPNPAHLKGSARQSEEKIQAALVNLTTPEDSESIAQSAVYPVYLWLNFKDSPVTLPSQKNQKTPKNRDNTESEIEGEDKTRRRAKSVKKDDNKAPFVMFFRAESLLSWAEFMNINRADDDDKNPDALKYAADMPELAIDKNGEKAASRFRFDLDLPAAEQDDAILKGGILLPEWDWKRAVLKPDFCAVELLEYQGSAEFHLTPEIKQLSRRIQKKLEILRALPQKRFKEEDGDEIDLDAWLRFSADKKSGQQIETPRVFINKIKAERSFSSLLLADLSLSTDAYVYCKKPDGTQYSRKIIDIIREALFIFGQALNAARDPFAILGFSSVKREHIRIHPLKKFEEAWAAPIFKRLAGIKPGYYTRMGAAVRYATTLFKNRPERQRLFLILTDGKPNDLDVYEGRYGLEDTKMAIIEARRAGVIPFCVTIDEAAHDYLPMLFGENRYILVHQAEDLVHKLAQIYAHFAR